MARYIAIPPDALTERLDTMGFVPIEVPGTHELVYERRHHRKPHTAVRVFTTISAGLHSHQHQLRMRDKDSDAIRIVGVVYLENGRVIGARAPKFKVLRAGTAGVEGVLERIRQRCREVYRAL